jgi:DNA-binding CsgD family transcriptional regulator
MNCPHCSTPMYPKSFVDRFGMTPREAEVANLIVEGNRNDSIASQLGITEQTVKSHVTTAMKKAGVSSRIGLVRIAFGMEAV